MQGSALPGLACLLVMLASLVCQAQPARAATDPYAALKKQLSASIREKMAANGVRGLSVALVLGRETVWAQGFGLADETAGVSARPDTVYRAGSISKVVTSMRAMGLARAGRLDIDADIREYVPGFSIGDRFGGPRSITPRLAMTHHSGLPTDVVAGMWSEHPESLAEYIPKLARESLASPPGEQFRYSNVAFSLLGRAMELVEGRHFAECMRLGLLEPLGLRSSSYVMTPELVGRYAAGYRFGREAPRPLLRDQPAGSLFTTVEDLAGLLAAVFAALGDDAAPSPVGDSRSRTALSAPPGLAVDSAGQPAETHTTSAPLPTLHGADMRRMLTPQHPGLPLDFGMDMGLGWMLSGLTLRDGTPLVWHGGAATPHQAFLAFVPGEDIGVALLANSDEASRFLATLTLEALELLRQARTGLKTVPAPKPTWPRPTPLDAAQAARVMGSYATLAGQLGSVWLEGGGLRMWLGDRTIELAPLGNGVFLPRREALFGLVGRISTDTALVFQEAAGREVLVLTGGAMPLPFAKVPVREIPPAWTGRFGRYETASPGQGISYRWLELAERQGLLVAIIGVSSGLPGAPEARAVFPLLPVSDSEAVIAGIGTGTGAVVRLEADGRIYHSGYDFRRVPGN